MAQSQLDQVIESYVKSLLNDEEKRDPASVKRLTGALKHELLPDMRDEITLEMKAELDRRREAMIAEAEGHKRRIIKRAEKSLIYEAVFVAFLIGMIVNQATYLLPENRLWAGFVIITALLICVLLIRAETEGD